ncbi:MAG: urease accessory protein [Rhodospirillales bacterium]|nr:urease accessory protein [Rhodospirillales bacterium]
MISILALGLLIGMQHALEADHVAAVSAIAARQTSARKIISHGAVWGVGHTITLMIVAGFGLFLGLEISGEMSGWLESAVGLVLILLGGHLLFKLIRDRIHFHRHRHGNNHEHFHAHSHAGEKQAHEKLAHDHQHRNKLPVRTLLVGMMHGLAGSAALMVLTAQTVQSPVIGFGYIVLFGIGSVLGMAALSAVIAVPLSYSARALTWANRGIQSAVAVWTLFLGLYVVYQSLPLLA